MAIPLLTGAGGTVSTANSTTVNLAASAVFTGASEDVSLYSHITVSIFSSHASATDGLSMQQSPDGTNWDQVDAYTITAATGKTFSTAVNAKFYRLVYTNGATLTTALRIQTIYSVGVKRSTSIRPQDARANDNDFEEIVAHLMGYNGTTWDRLRATIANGLAVDVIRHPTLTKNAQGATGVSTQDLKDAGRNHVHFYMVIPVLATATDALQSLTGTKAGATVVATTTPAVVTAGKTLRITRLAATYIATATSGFGIVRLRANTGGVVAITSPVVAALTVGAGNPATANSTGSEEATLEEGLEFAAGTGIGISVQGFAAATATAVGYIIASVTGYEY